MARKRGRRPGPIPFKWNYVRVRAPDGYAGRMTKWGFAYEHRLVAEKALGHLLPKGAEVHHVDENPRNNVGSNLVICQDRAYHWLIHQRTRAYKATGHADWRQCHWCQKWEAPEDIYISPRGMSIHRECANERMRQSPYYLAKPWRNK